VIAVSNASPLISLHRVEALPLLQQLFTEVLVPSAVVREVVG
jgi:predicted nucleic acid-binding protein